MVSRVSSLSFRMHTEQQIWDIAIFTPPSPLQSRVRFKLALEHHLCIYMVIQVVHYKNICLFSPAFPKRCWESPSLTNAVAAEHAQHPWAWEKDGFCYLQRFNVHEFPPQIGVHSSRRIWAFGKHRAAQPEGSMGFSRLKPAVRYVVTFPRNSKSCTTAVRQSFVWQYFQQLFQSCWEMRGFSLEMGRRISFCLLSKAVLWCMRPNYKPSGAKLVISTFYRLSGWSKTFSSAQ